MIRLLLLIAFSLQVEAATFVHGNDLEKDQDNIWFLGKEAVSYCVESSEDYPFDKESLKQLVKEAFEQWRDFFKKYRMDQKKFSGFVDGKRRGLSMNFRFQADCQEDGDILKILFGRSDELVNHHRPDKGHSLGVAIRRGYDFKDFKNGGTVWISNFSTDRQKVLHVLLHELGHVFGMLHDSVWVMDTHMATRLKKSKDPAFGRIESPSWKYALTKGDDVEFTYRGQPSADGTPMLGNHYLSWARTLFGARIAGIHSMTLRFEPGFDSADPESPMPIKKFILEVLVAGKDPVKIPGTFDPLLSLAAGPVVYGPWKNNDGDITFYKKRLSRQAFAVPASGYFTFPDGTTVPAVMKYERGPVLGLFVPDRFGKRHWWWSSRYEKGFAELRRRER